MGPKKWAWDLARHLKEQFKLEVQDVQLAYMIQDWMEENIENYEGE